MTAITPETRHAIEQAGEQPVQLTDPETKSVYVIVRADVYAAHPLDVRRLRHTGCVPTDGPGGCS